MGGPGSEKPCMPARDTRFPSVNKFEIGSLLSLYLAILVGLIVLLFATRSDLVSLVLNVLSDLYRSWANF